MGEVLKTAVSFLVFIEVIVFLDPRICMWLCRIIQINLKYLNKIIFILSLAFTLTWYRIRVFFLIVK